MVRITEELVRKKCEHNEGEIYSLEELSLHQEDIERIEHLDKWCRDLKILLLQGNLIPKIENVGRFKKLEYINLALNNVTRIENLEGCESLEKVDLTVNFVGELTTVENLKKNEFLRTLYLTGNPCTDFEMYREYVIATLPQLQCLDGTDIEKSERIKAMQVYTEAKRKIIQQQNEYMKKEKARKAKREIESQEKTDDDDTDFWSQVGDHTPETRIQIHKKVQESKQKDDGNKEEQPKREIRLRSSDGRILNINEPKIDFTLTDDEENNQFVLDLAVYRYLDTSLLDVDINPTHVTVCIKKKVFQMTLSEEINPEESTVQRSEITGHLVLTMPKVKEIIRPKTNTNKAKPCLTLKGQKSDGCDDSPACLISCIDICSIVPESSQEFSPPYEITKKQVVERPNSEGFVDDSSVPPLM